MQATYRWGQHTKEHATELPMTPALLKMREWLLAYSAESVKVEHPGAKGRIPYKWNQWFLGRVEPADDWEEVDGRRRYRVHLAFE